MTLRFEDIETGKTYKLLRPEEYVLGGIDCRFEALNPDGVSRDFFVHNGAWHGTLTALPNGEYSVYVKQTKREYTCPLIITLIGGDEEADLVDYEDDDFEDDIPF